MCSAIVLFGEPSKRDIDLACVDANLALLRRMGRLVKWSEMGETSEPSARLEAILLGLNEASILAPRSFSSSPLPSGGSLAAGSKRAAELLNRSTLTKLAGIRLRGNHGVLWSVYFPTHRRTPPRHGERCEATGGVGTSRQGD